MSKNQQQKDWYKKTIEKIDNIMSSDKDIADKYLEIYKYTRIALDGEPTTADEHNTGIIKLDDEYHAKAKIELEKVNRALDTIKEDVQLGASIVKSNDEVSGVFMSDGKIEQIDYESSPENTVRISDINKEIAKEWNRDREERINKKKSK